MVLASVERRLVGAVDTPKGGSYSPLPLVFGRAKRGVSDRQKTLGMRRARNCPLRGEPAQVKETVNGNQD